jgi:hypothetical protein
MCDTCETDLDSLPRSELGETELGDMPYDVAKVLDIWLHEQHGVMSSHHGVGAFLDELAAAGYRVTAIDPGPPIEELLPASVD